MEYRESIDVVRMDVDRLKSLWNPIPIDLVVCWITNVEETIPNSIIVHETHVPDVNAMLVVCFGPIVIWFGHPEWFPISPREQKTHICVTRSLH